MTGGGPKISFYDHLKLRFGFLAQCFSNNCNFRLALKKIWYPCGIHPPALLAILDKLKPNVAFFWEIGSLTESICTSIFLVVSIWASALKKVSEYKFNILKLTVKNFSWWYKNFKFENILIYRNLYLILATVNIN